MKKSVSIVGGGTAGLFLAAFLDPGLFDITIFEKKAANGRKFLVAGDGGFNLTHSESMDGFIQRFTPDHFLKPALENFSNEDLRSWFESLDIPTFVGSSKRVFPEKGIKPIMVLKAIESFLLKRGVVFKFKKKFSGWDEQHNLVFNSREVIESDYQVFALGGGSWKVTGSDGGWLETFADQGISTLPFQAANCAFQVNWSEDFLKKHEGEPLKNIAVAIENQSQKGEAVITKFGIEGNAIYALSPKIQAELALQQKAVIHVDFKPMLSTDELFRKLQNSRHNTTKTLKQSIKLSPPVLDLIKSTLSKDVFMDNALLAKSIKAFPITILDSAPIDEAISTSGGISLKAVDTNFELNKLKNNFCIGEMLDWNAPTGGYLIQGCASMGVHLANHLNERQAGAGNE